MRLAGRALVAVCCMWDLGAVCCCREQCLDWRGLCKVLPKMALTAAAANSDGSVTALARAAAAVVGLSQRHSVVDDVSQNVVGTY